MQKSIIVFVLASIVFSTNAQILSSSCPSSPVLTNFDASRYVGKWYENERFTSRIEENLKCVYADYTAVNGSYIGVQNSGFNVLSSQYDRINGYAYVPNSNIPNQLLVVLKVPIAGFFLETTGKYDVWATDYVNYALVYSCQQIPQINQKVENFWILSRTKTLDSSIVRNLKSILNASNINSALLQPTLQDC